MGAIMFVCRYLLRTCLRSSINRALEHFASPGATCTLFRQLELDSSAHQSVDTDIKPTSENNFSYGGFYCSPSFGVPGGMFFNDGTYSSIRRITVTNGYRQYNLIMASKVKNSGEFDMEVPMEPQ